MFVCVYGGVVENASVITKSTVLLSRVHPQLGPYSDVLRFQVHVQIKKRMP